MYHFLLSSHIIPLKFSSWNIICFGLEELIKVQFFRLLSVFTLEAPILSKWSNTLEQFVGNFPENCLIVFDHSLGLAPKGLMKVHQIPHAIFETTRLRLIQILRHRSVSWKITPLYFFNSKLYPFHKKSQLKWYFQTFDWFGENSPNSSYHVWNTI